MDQNQAKIYLELLLKLKEDYGDLNCALVEMCISVHGHKSLQLTANKIGVNKSVVDRALKMRKKKQSVSNRNTT